MKLVLSLKYDINLKDWNMDCIKDVRKIFDKVSKGIHLRLQYLFSNKPEKIQWFQDTRFLILLQHVEVESLYSDLSRSFPHEYHSDQFQNQELPLFS